ncbi:hypothetical protein CVT24_006438 [Panaeolus cyanescens]|uniref:Uncharacterized protein n=1 Tax=Panaeolus cyanescens TaxID=181874 RepID=A0A409VZ68_9AGAR|nr:hypothetical protein CVT24_006438 [Panaeolus cyanescens]
MKFNLTLVVLSTLVSSTLGWFPTQGPYTIDTLLNLCVSGGENTYVGVRYSDNIYRTFAFDDCYPFEVNGHLIEAALFCKSVTCYGHPKLNCTGGAVPPVPIHIANGALLTNAGDFVQLIGQGPLSSESTRMKFTLTFVALSTLASSAFGQIPVLSEYVKLFQLCQAGGENTYVGVRYAGGNYKTFAFNECYPYVVDGNNAEMAVFCKGVTCYNNPNPDCTGGAVPPVPVPLLAGLTLINAAQWVQLLGQAVKYSDGQYRTFEFNECYPFDINGGIAQLAFFCKPVTCYLHPNPDCSGGTVPPVPIPIPAVAPIFLPNALDFIELVGKAATCQKNGLS